MKQSFKKLSFFLICLSAILVIVGCELNTQKAYTVTVDSIVNGSVIADKTVAVKGEEITLTVTADKGYCLETITINDQVLEGTTFNMPDSNVVIKAKFVLDKELYEVNPGINSSLKINAPSLGGSSATADLSIKLTENSVNVLAYVEDNSVVGQDGFAVLFSQVSPTINSLLPNGKTLKVGALINGTIINQRTNEEGVLVDSTFEQATANVKRWSKDGVLVTGYYVNVSVSYSDLGIAKEDVINKLTICPVVYNAYGSMSAMGSSFDNLLEDSQNTYKVVLGDDMLKDNDYLKGYAQLGSGPGIEKGAMWDTSKDYFKVDSSNYQNRVAILKGHDGMDNNLVFSDVSANIMYSEATIKLIGVANSSDQWPKYGMMLFNGSSQNGLFFYVDAVMNGNSDNTLDNIIGRDLGYNKGTDVWGSWITAKSNVFDLSSLTIKLGMVYQNGWVHLYANDTFVESVYAGEYNENMRFGFKSFGLEMEVTDYFASADPEADGWKDLIIEEKEATDVEALFAGDSYMDFWKSRHQSAHLSSYINSYANEGIGGTMVPLWIQKVGEMKKLYNPENILFHIGVNDIDSGAKPADVINDIKTLFTKYHEYFPNATIYWNSLIINTMFKDKMEAYYEVNAAIEEYMSNYDWLVYVNQTPSFELEHNVPNPMLLDDGLHMSTDFGYPIWSNNMLKAMGYTITENENFGEVNGFSSSGWTYNEDGSALVNQPTELITWFKNASGSNVYLEAMVSVGNLYGNDQYPKFGYVAANNENAVWGFIDAAGYPGKVTKQGSTVLRNFGKNNAGFECNMGWNWGTHILGTTFDGDYTNDNYVLLAIAKLDDVLYLAANSKIIATREFTGDVQFGFETFNLEVSIKDVKVIKEVSEIKNKLGMIEPDEAVIDGLANDDIYTSEVLDNKISLGDKGDGRHLEVLGVKGNNGVYFVITTYSKVNLRSSANWWENANIELRLGNDMNTQYYVLYDGVGFDKVKGSLGIDYLETSKAETVGELYKASVEFFVPFKYFTGYDQSSEELPIKIWGWVFDEGWSNIMNVGTWNELSVSSHGVRFANQVTVEGNNAAITVTPSKSFARVGDVITLDVNTTAELESITVNTVSGLSVELLSNDGIYSFVMPKEQVIVKSQLKGVSVTTKVTGLENKGTISCAQGIVSASEIVEFSVVAAADYLVKQVTVNGEALSLTQSGIYQYEVKPSDSKVEIVCDIDYDTEGYVIDGIANESYGEEIAFKVEDNRKVSVWAVKGNNGVYLYFEAYTNSLVNSDGGSWFLNHNFEFLLNMTQQSYINSRSESNHISKGIWNSTIVDSGRYQGKYLHTAEVFVHKDLINNFENDIVLNYAFKAPTELARNEWLPNNQYERGDYWYTSLGCIYAQDNAFLVNSVPSYLHITSNGIVNTKPVSTKGDVDGNLEKYANKESMYLGNDNAYYHISGFTHDDGYHFAFEIWHNLVSSPAPEWHLNDNIELTVGSASCGFSIVEDFLITRGPVSQYYFERSEATDRPGYAYKTVIELFIPLTTNLSKDAYVWVGTNGNGFNGWQPLCWDGNLAFINKDGINFPNGFASLDGITLDGINSESIQYGDGVVFNPNGSTIQFTGKKLSHGAIYYIDVTHLQPVENQVNGTNNEWWNYLNFEIYQGFNCPQSKTSVIGSGYSYWCHSAYHTETVDGKYHTTFEVYIPYGMSFGAYSGGDLQVALGIVCDGGYAWGAVWDNQLYLTDSGIVYR